MSIPVYIILAILLLVLISGGYTFVLACCRRKEMQWLDRKAVESSDYKGYYPHILQAETWVREHNAKTVSVTSDDGLTLRGLWVAAEDPVGTILLAHGYRSTWRVDMSLVLSVYHEMGLNLLIPDQRAHGMSEGKFITFGVKESRDMERWVAYHNQQFGPFALILSGLSMGASTVLFLADKVLPSNVKGIIADCGFTSPAEIISDVFRKVIHLPAQPSVRVADIFCRIFAGFSLYEMDSRKTLAASRLPVLMVHGKADGFVPHEMSVAGHSACTSEKELLLVEDADHGVSFLKDQEGYTKAIRSFISKNIGEIR